MTELKNHHSMIMCWDFNHRQGWERSYMLPVNFFRYKNKRFTFTRKFVQSYNGDSHKVYILASYPKCLSKIHSDFSFLPARIMIDRYLKLVCRMYDKKFLKFALEYGLVLQKFIV